MRHIISFDFLKKILVLTFTIIEGLLLIRIILKIISASHQSLFVQWLYQITGILVMPFQGMFPNHIQGIPYEIELSSIFGMIIYALIGYIVLYLITIVEKPKRRI